MYLDLNKVIMIIGAPLNLCRVRDSDRSLGFNVLKSSLGCCSLYIEIDCDFGVQHM